VFVFVRCVLVERRGFSETEKGRERERERQRKRERGGGDVEGAKSRKSPNGREGHLGVVGIRESWLTSCFSRFSPWNGQEGCVGF
jgi:hypothetical protein